MDGMPKLPKCPRSNTVKNVFRLDEVVEPEPPHMHILMRTGEAYIGLREDCPICHRFMQKLERDVWEHGIKQDKRDAIDGR